MILCVAAALRVGDTYLCVSRKDAPDKFCFPGGKVEPDDESSTYEDTVINAAIRELKEETGLTARWMDANLMFQTSQFGDKKCYTALVAIKKASGMWVPEPGTTIKMLKYEEFMAVCAFPGFYELAHVKGVIW